MLNQKYVQKVAHLIYLSKRLESGLGIGRVPTGTRKVLLHTAAVLHACKEHDEYCGDCRYTTEHRGCTACQPWKY